MRTVRLFGGLLLLVIATWLFLPLTAKAAGNGPKSSRSGRNPSLRQEPSSPGQPFHHIRPRPENGKGCGASLSRSSSRLVGRDEVPSGLEAGEWQAIKKQMVLHRHRVQPASGDAYQAVNPAQQFQANFAEGGM